MTSLMRTAEAETRSSTAAPTGAGKRLCSKKPAASARAHTAAKTAAPRREPRGALDAFEDLAPFAARGRAERALSGDACLPADKGTPPAVF